MNYLLVLPPTFPHWQTFTDLRKGIAKRLESQGHTVAFDNAINPTYPLEQQVLFGANACRDEDYMPGVVIYQGEALSSYWMKQQTYINRLAQASDIWSWQTVTPLCWEDKRLEVPVVPGRVVHVGCLSARRMQACIDVSAVPVLGLWGDDCNKILDSAELEIELLFDYRWEPCSLRLARATSRGRLLLTECHPDPAYALNWQHIKTQVERILSFTDKEKQEWLDNQRETVTNWRQ